MSDERETAPRPGGVRAITAALAVAALLATTAFVGCGSDSGNGPAGQATGTQEPEVDRGDEDAPRSSEEKPVGETSRDGAFAFTVTRFAPVSEIPLSSGGTLTAEPGARLVEVVVEATNQSSQPARAPLCAPAYYGIVLVDAASRNYSADSDSWDIAGGSEDPYCMGAVQPGLSVTTKLAFQIPETAGELGVAVWDPSEPGDEFGNESYVTFHPGGP